MSIQHPPIQPFKVAWEDLPPALRPVPDSSIEKIKRIAWNILSVVIPLIGLARLAGYGIKCLARLAILPAAFHSEKVKQASAGLFHHSCDHIARNFSGTIMPKSVAISTPDGAIINATVFRRSLNPNTPTCIYFNGNAALKSLRSAGWVLDSPYPTNLVVFDYRSAGESKGFFNDTRDLLIDGASLVHWVRQDLKTPDDKIHFYGTSLGGAVALKTKALDKRLTGAFLSDRSFASIESVLKSWTKNIHFFFKPLRALIIWTLKKQFMELDAASDYRKLKGRSLLFYHKQDEIIPYEASLAAAVGKDAFELEAIASMPQADHHNELLYEYHGAIPKAASFLATQ